jgi:flavin-dependent dehydrogenase
LGDCRACGPVRGSPLRTGVYRARQVADNVLVVGEAANLVNPLTGEGIAAALRSGHMAAEHARTALETDRTDGVALRSYERDLRRAFGADHRAADILRAVMAHPGVVNRVVRRARDDREFGVQIGLGILGVTGPRRLLHARMLIRYLM